MRSSRVFSSRVVVYSVVGSTDTSVYKQSRNCVENCLFDHLLQPWSSGLKATQLSLSDHVQWKWSETRSFELQSRLSNLKWSSFILSTLCSRREYIGQVLQLCMQREVESPEKRSRVRTLQLGSLRLLGRILQRLFATEQQYTALHSCLMF